MFMVPGPDVAQEQQLSPWWGCFGPSPAVGSPQCVPPASPANGRQGWAVLEGLIPTSWGHHGYTPGHLCLVCPQQPSTGCRATLRAWGIPVLPLPPFLGQHWAPPADVHTSDAIPNFHNTDTKSRCQPDISTLLLAARGSCPARPRMDGLRDISDPTETLQHPAPLGEPQNRIWDAPTSPARARAVLPTLWSAFCHCWTQTLFIAFVL